MTRRFRLDSTTAGEMLALCNEIGWRYYDRPHQEFLAATDRCQRLLLHWWAVGHDPARALRCPECRGLGRCKALTWAGSIVVYDCGSCNGRGTR